MAPPLHYLTAPDGVRVAYTTFGSGPGVPVVALRPSHAEPHRARVAALPAAPPSPSGAPSSSRVADASSDSTSRGCGLSDRDVADRSLDTRVADLTAVVDRVGLERFASTRSTRGRYLGIAYAASPSGAGVAPGARRRVAAQGPGHGTRRGRRRSTPSPRGGLGSSARTRSGCSSIGWSDVAREFAAYSRACVRKEDYFAFRDADLGGRNLAPILPQIAAPTLVCTSPSLAHLMRADLAREVISGLRDAPRLVSARTPEERLRATRGVPRRHALRAHRRAHSRGERGRLPHRPLHRPRRPHRDDVPPRRRARAGCAAEHERITREC